MLCLFYPLTDTLSQAWSVNTVVKIILFGFWFGFWGLVFGFFFYTFAITIPKVQPNS